MYKSLLHLSADIIGLVIIVVTLRAKPATAEPTNVVSPSSAKVVTPAQPALHSNVAAPIQSPPTPTGQADIVSGKSSPQNSLPQNSPPQNSPPKNNLPVAIESPSVGNNPPIIPVVTSTIPSQQSFAREHPPSKLPKGQINIGNYLFDPARSTAASNNTLSPTTRSSEVATKTTSSPELQIESRLNAAQTAYDRVAVKLAEVQGATPEATPSQELIAAQQAERVAAAELSKVQAEARQFMGTLKSYR